MLTRFQIANFVKSYPYYKEEGRKNEAIVKGEDKWLRDPLDKVLQQPERQQAIENRVKKLVSKGEEPERAKKQAARLEKQETDKRRNKLRVNAATVEERSRVNKKTAGREAALKLNEEYIGGISKGEALDSAISTLKKPGVKATRQDLLVLDRDRTLKSGELDSLLEKTKQELSKSDLDPKQRAKLQNRQQNIEDKLSVVKRKAPSPEDVKRAAQSVNNSTSKTEALKNAFTKVGAIRQTSEPKEVSYPAYTKETKTSKSGKPRTEVKRTTGTYTYKPSVIDPSNMGTRRTVERLQKTQQYANSLINPTPEPTQTPLELPKRESSPPPSPPQATSTKESPKTPKATKTNNEAVHDPINRNNAVQKVKSLNTQRNRKVAGVGLGLLGAGAAVAGGKYLYDRYEQGKKEKAIKDKLMYSSYM